MGDAKQLRRNFLWNTFGQIVYMVCHFLFGILILSLAGAEQSGIFTTAVSATGIFLSIASYGMYSFPGVGRHRESTAQSCLHPQPCLWTGGAGQRRCASCFAAGGRPAARKTHTARSRASAYLLLPWAYRMVESLTDVYNAIEPAQAGRLDLVGKTYALRGRGDAGGLLRWRVLAATHSLLLTLALMLGVNIALFCTYTMPRVARAFYRAAAGGKKRCAAALLFECAAAGGVHSAFNTTAASHAENRCCSSQMGERGHWHLRAGDTACRCFCRRARPICLIPFINVFTDSYARQRTKRASGRLCWAYRPWCWHFCPQGLVGGALSGTNGALTTFVAQRHEPLTSICWPLW